MRDFAETLIAIKQDIEKAGKQLDGNKELEGKLIRIYRYAIYAAWPALREDQFEH